MRSVGTKNRSSQRTGPCSLTKDGSLQRSAGSSSKRTADLWIEMLKQVHDDVCLTKNEQPVRIASEQRTVLLKGR